MDYAPDKDARIAGLDFTHGIIRREHGGCATIVGRAVAKRLSLHRAGEVDCFDHEVLLPPHAPDVFRKLDHLVATYQKQLLPSQCDLLGIATLRFDPGERFHHQWELARSFARASLNARNLAAIMVHHVPALAGRGHKPHIHILYPVRALHGTFGPFVPLTGATLAAEWKGYLNSS